MSIRTLKDNVAIVPIEDDEKRGSLYIPEQAQQRVDQGVIVYKGPDVKELEIGQHVLFSGYTGDKISIEDDGIYFIIPEDYIIAIIIDDGASLILPVGTIKGIIKARLGELRSRPSWEDVVTADEFAEDIMDRLDSYITDAGFEF
jgi:co-chaperonin GroES (HSP10)